MENIKTGFKKLYLAQILTIIGALNFLVTKEYWYLGIVFIVLDIAAFFINLKGLKILSSDYEGYNKAYKFAIAGIVVDLVALVLAFVFNNNPEVGKIVDSTTKALSNAIEYGICWLVLKTSVELCNSKGLVDIADYAKKTSALLTFCYAVGILIDLFNTSQTWALLVVLAVAVITLVVFVMGQIRYIIFLKKMRDNF